ncbi:MAG: hypothetical protein HQL23_00530 [Candidatus Omnitrophica bacterium]|nr:hypothetical protein [Candidatus Omnitrophota bacterium]
MQTKKAEIQARKDRVLAITVGQYIHHISPVSSALIVEKYLPELSSATVRNILAELEEEGYLTHPHTSAGRVPTQWGYRYYVDYLMEEIYLLEEEKRRIKMEYDRKTRELEDILDRTSKVLAETTHYTSLVSIDGDLRRVFCRGTNFIAAYPDYQDIESIRHILFALDEKERLLDMINRDLQRKIDIHIGQEIRCQGMTTCSLVVSRYKTHHGPSGRLAVLGPTRMDYERVVSTLDYFSRLLEEMW